ncbi:UPF0061-domain-containing protein [Suhomyces tanzawaensis NRRL Y-17324]|uniref:Selenoprotein O n=1 Tax=Suhomyces tanzawaensis NRRL Y-17324 TaxID=984487 RepID=A0A1E4SLL5_9ASCO|nr:UPF0061-domain-containing protein [Suhomyces tanzawaensis NRRL Y-17324]ODV80409.1 UPF0061-domain-containing protein [Suhomyces tanzawaensis NRRL Y-17324]
MVHTTKLWEVPKQLTFTRKLDPDFRIPSQDIAAKNEDNIIHKPRVLISGSFSWSLPEVRKEYRYLTSNDNALESLGLDPEQVADPRYQKVVSGEVYAESDFEDKGYPFPYAQAYAGWQFGQFAGQLGDGRVVNLFELEKPTNQGVRVPALANRNKYEVQLKGSGMTPFSRFADGKAVLRSSIREYIISEHLNAIGIPSTRALSLTYLPQTYAQRHAAEKCAIVSRFAELWIRLGSFDLYRWRGDRDGIRKLADYVIDELFTIDGKQFQHWKEILEKKDFLKDSSGINELTKYDNFYYETIVRNATTTAIWQCYGFLNGVLNTDNTSILGLSLDFGPFSIMDKYDPNYTPNSEDHQLRYGYKNTPTSIWWNLTRLGEDLAELIGGARLLDDEDFIKGNFKEEWEDEIISRATTVIEVGGEIYKYTFTKKYVETFFSRLGLSHKLIDESDPDKANSELIAPMLDMLYKVQCDFNKFFLVLQETEIEDESRFNATDIAETILLPVFNEDAPSRYDKNDLIEEITSWLGIFRRYVKESRNIDPTHSRTESKLYNPLFLPRNWILDQVIKHTEDSAGQDLTYLKKLEKMSSNPYDRSKWGTDLKELEDRWILQGDMGEDYAMLQCSCSS